jgi:serine-type D-Ala-D-Ala carboxypeptidase/endopeptidase (penicillin-binding protein 4)
VPDDEPYADPPAASPSRSRRRSRWPAVLVVLVLLALTAAAYRLVVVDGLGQDPPAPAPDPTREPAAVPPPPGLELPDPASARQVTRALTEGGGDDGDIDPRAVRRALAPVLDTRKMGRRVAVAVAGLDGRAAYEVGPRTVTPASTMKLLTSLAALETLGPEHRFETRTVRSGRVLTLVGGGDPLLMRRPQDPDTYPARADLVTLARATATRLAAEGRTKMRLAYDDTLVTGPAVSPDWEPNYLPDDVVSPITALWVDEGREDEGLVPRSEDPAAAAAQLFAGALRAQGVRVTGVRQEPAPAKARSVAVVRGAELVEVVQHVLEVSDNEGAEVLARHVALAEGRPASFDGASRAVRSVARDLGVPLEGAVVRDGSGLSREDRLGVRTLLALLAAGADPERPELGGLLEGLPVAGFSGSLAGRFLVRADAALGFVRAKTGTLTGVHGLAGVTVGRDGIPLLFVAVADEVALRNTLAARARLERIAAALTACSCAAR